MAAASGFLLAWEELLMTSFCMAATLNGLRRRCVMAANYGLDRLCN